MPMGQLWNPTADFSFACKLNNNECNSYIANVNINIVRQFSVLIWYNAMNLALIPFPLLCDDIVESWNK